MPRGLHLIVCENTSIDKFTNLFSAFALIERLGAEAEVPADKPMPTAIPYPLVCRAVATWMKEPQDGDQLYQASIHLDWLGKRLTHPGEKFAFQEGMILHRSIFAVSAPILVPVGTEVAVWVRVMLYREGESEPVAAVEYPIHVTATATHASNAPQSGQ